MTTVDQVILREGSPTALHEMRGQLAAAGIAARITKATGCNPNG